MAVTTACPCSGEVWQTRPSSQRPRLSKWPPQRSPSPRAHTSQQPHTSRTTRPGQSAGAQEAFSQGAQERAAVSERPPSSSSAVSAGPVMVDGHRAPVSGHRSHGSLGGGRSTGEAARHRSRQRPEVVEFTSDRRQMDADRPTAAARARFASIAEAPLTRRDRATMSPRRPARRPDSGGGSSGVGRQTALASPGRPTTVNDDQPGLLTADAEAADC